MFRRVVNAYAALGTENPRVLVTTVCDTDKTLGNTVYL